MIATLERTVAPTSSSYSAGQCWNLESNPNSKAPGTYCIMIGKVGSSERLKIPKGPWESFLCCLGPGCLWAPCI